MRVIIVLLAAMLLLKTSQAYPQGACADSYAACMASCASVRTPERCMQTCHAEESRCNVAGASRAQGGTKSLARSGVDLGLDRWKYDDTRPAGKRNAPRGADR